MKLKILEGIGLVCWCVTLLTLAITLAINSRWLYTLDIQHLHLLDYVTFGKKDLLHNYDELMRYLNLPWVTSLNLPDFPVSKSGAFHFKEVKQLFLLNYGVLLVSLIPSGLYLHHLKKNQRVWTLYQPFQFIALIPVVLAFMMAVNFDQFFIAFHGVFFNNQAWIFDPVTDPVINVLPETFFLHCFILFFVLFELFLISQMIIGKRALKKIN